MDGVLVDSNPFHFEAWTQLSHRHQRQLSREELQYGLSGRKSEDILRYLFGEDLLPHQLDDLALEKEDLFRTLIRGQAQPIPGLPAMLEELARLGWRSAVATSAPRANLELTLDELGLGDFFGAEVTAEDVQIGKPHPQVYQLAAQRLGMPPAACIVFEDAVAGIEAGRRAGMMTVGLATTRPAAELEAAGADLVVADFTHLTPALLSEHLGRRMERSGASLRPGE
jgi:HAD superfamily hydrolase (TIGR01509 family)